jgi:cysteine desulfurase
VSRIYLDNNATTCPAPEVIDAVHRAMTCYGNPSSIHSFGQEAKGLLLHARDTIASYFQVPSKEILFGSSATELLNTLIRSIPSGHVVSSSLEHAAVYNTLQAHPKTTFLPGTTFGAPTLREVEAAIRPDTQLIALMAVNNETGVRTDIAAIGAHAKALGIPFIVDGVGLLGKELFTIPEGVSAMVFSAHKIHGPKGAACAFIRKNFPFSPLIRGGEQESGRRGGTEDLPAIMGFQMAVQLLQQTLSSALSTMQKLRLTFEEELLALGDVLVNGDGPRVTNTSNLAFLGVEGEELLRELDLKGVAASHGSACTSGSLEPSRPLQNMGYSKERVGSSLRFSLSRYTTSDEMERAALLIKQAVKKLR